MKRFVILFLLVWLSCPCWANIIEANQAVQKEKYNKAKPLLEKYARVGHAQAQFSLAVLLYQGKFGKVDKVTAYGWMSLAAEYEYPQSSEFAGSIYAELNSQAQEKAKTRLAEYLEKFGRSALNKKLFPEISPDPIANQVIKKSSQVLGPDNASSHSVKESSSLKSSGNRKAKGDAVQYLDNKKRSIGPGMVNVIFDVNEKGQASDAEVIFSYPSAEKVDKTVIQKVYQSKYTSAKNKNKKNVKQYGKVFRIRHGVAHGGNLANDYPDIYTRFKKQRKQSKTDVVAKYNYAKMLRAYGEHLPKKDRAVFSVPLKEAADEGLLAAQYDYAMYNIYQKQDLDAGLPWMIKAAKGGYLNAEYRLGDLLYQPNSAFLKKDVRKAKYWLKRAAQKGHIKALEKVAEIDLVKRDAEKAKRIVKLFEKIKDPNKMTGAAHYYYAKALFFSGDKGNAKKQIAKALKAGKKTSEPTASWQALKEQIINS